MSTMRWCGSTLATCGSCVGCDREIGQRRLRALFVEFGAAKTRIGSTVRLRILPRNLQASGVSSHS